MRPGPEERRVAPDGRLTAGDERGPPQFTVAHLLVWTTLCGGVFWLVRTTGLAATLLVLGVAANLILNRALGSVSMWSGAMWGAVAHGAMLGVLWLVDGPPPRPALAFAVYVLPGAWLGAMTAAWRQALDLAGVDRPPPPRAPPGGPP